MPLPPLSDGVGREHGILDSLGDDPPGFVMDGLLGSLAVHSVRGGTQAFQSIVALENAS